ncbi:diguanylate cyclase domain-containing protein [Hydrogenophaga aquatica]
MRLGIAAKLALLLTLVGVLAGGIAAIHSYLITRDLLVDAAKARLLTSTQVLATRITTSREEVSRLLQMLAEHPVTRATLARPQPQLDDQLATLFEQAMLANPSYNQIRLISAQGYGLERVRVERDEKRLVRVTGDDLQEKGHFAYVSQALKLPRGATYLSRIAINHERGTAFNMDKPTIVLAMPVVPLDGQPPLGVVVVNVDLRAVFRLLAADLPGEFRLFLANGEGDVLVHPDSSRTFGFDRGRRVLIQDEFPAIQALVAVPSGEVVFEAPTSSADTPLVAAFVRRDLAVASDEKGLMLGLAQPLSSVLQEFNRPRTDIVLGALLLSLGCVVVAVVLAGAVTRPINAIKQAAGRFAAGQVDASLPVDRSDEIGDLARSFQGMQDQIAHQMVTLRDNREELEHMVQHDSLTGLPNRRMLQERLEQAIARARRNNEHVTLMFVDLDRFKDINDRLGHDAGDYVLRIVARRMQGVLREIDTVARLGGDEFVVLLDAPSPPPEGIVTVAMKIIDQARADIPYGMRTLNVGASIGISQYPEDGLTAMDLIVAADRAMYRAKADGRQTFCFASA